MHKLKMVLQKSRLMYSGIQGSEEGTVIDFSLCEKLEKMHRDAVSFTMFFEVTGTENFIGALYIVPNQLVMTTSVPERSALWALQEEVPGYISGRTNWRNDFFRIDSGLGGSEYSRVNFIALVFTDRQGIP